MGKAPDRERRSWWRMVTPVAGLAAVATALAGIGVFAWAVLVNDGSNEIDSAELTLDVVYANAIDGITRPGSVLHTIITDPVTLTNEGEEIVPTSELWISVEQDAARVRSTGVSEGDADEWERLYVGSFVYYPDDPGEALRAVVELQCPGTKSTILAILFRCAGATFSPEAPDESYIESGEFEGATAIVHVTEDISTIELSEEDTPLPTGLTGTSLGEIVEIRIVWSVYIDPATYLPMAHVMTYERDGEELGSFVSRYEHEFIALDSLGSDFFDPHAIGYGAPNVEPLIAKIENEVPVYWLGEELDLTVDNRCPAAPMYCTFVLTQVVPGSESGPSGVLVYESPTGLLLLKIRLWRHEAWAEHLSVLEQQLLSDPDCVGRQEVDVGGVRLTAFALPKISFPVPEDFDCGIRLRDSLIGPQNVFTFAVLDDVVLELRPWWNNAYDTVDGVEFIVENLREH